MAGSGLGRSLQRFPLELYHRSEDPQDPRIGNVIVHASDIPADCRRAAVIVGVPQDIGVERNGGRAGAAQAPRAIRLALSKLTLGPLADGLATGEFVLADAGDIDVSGKTLEQIHDEQHDIVSAILSAGHFPIVLGGGHDCAWPTLRALESRGLPFGVINIDAHADVRPLKEGRAHSGSAFHQLLSLTPSHLLAGGFAEFGLQPHSVANAHLDFVRDHGMQVWMLDEIREHGVPAAWQRVWDACSVAQRTYVSVDMDAFASAYAPGVSAPAADGFTPAEIAPCLRHAALSGSLVAFDVVECNPVLDIDGRTAKLAAMMIAEVVGARRGLAR